MVCLSLLGAACATPPADPGADAAPAATTPAAEATDAAEATAELPVAPADLAAAEVALTAVAAGTAPPGSYAAFPPDLVAARAAASSGERGDAARRYVAVLEREPEHNLALLGLARLRMQENRYRAAATLLERLERARDAAGLAQHPDQAWLHGTAMLRGGELDRGIAALREELATGPRAAEAASALFDYFTATEAYAEALAILDAALARLPEHLGLRYLRALALRDVFRFAEAREMMRALVDEYPDESRFRVTLAELERFLGAPDAALEVLEPVLSAPVVGGAPEAVVNRRAAAERLAVELRAEIAGEPRKFTAIELLAAVRGHPSVYERVRALKPLLVADETRDPAIRAALASDEPVLRVQAVRAVPARDSRYDPLLAAALGDPDPKVRAAAAAKISGDAMRSDWIPKLVDALETEQDSYAFRRIHEALSTLRGPIVRLEYEGEKSAEIRRETYEAWRRACQR